MNALLAESATVDLITAGRIQQVHVGPTEAEVGRIGDNRWHRQDEVHAARLVTDLHTQLAGHVQPPFTVDRHAIQRRFVCAIG